MPIYAYTCDQCGNDWQENRAIKKRNHYARCRKCGATGRRDLHAEQGHMAKGELPEWASVNAGVLPADIERANKHPAYVGMGVRFDQKGIAHVPGKARKAFLKERGMREL